MTARWQERSCDRCEELEEILEAQDQHIAHLERELDTCTIQFSVCMTELSAANYARGQERERADDYERRLIARRERDNERR